MICCENFNSFTIYAILEKLNNFIEQKHINREDIISISVCRDGSIDLFYWNN